MHLAVIIKVLPFILLPLLSCEKNRELFPWQCDCDIDTIQLSQPSLVTYQVFAANEASVSSVTYQTNDGPVTTQHASLPFSTTVQLGAGATIALTAKGDPGNGAIVLSYEIKDSERPSNALSSSVSKVWILKDGICQ